MEKPWLTHNDQKPLTKPRQEASIRKNDFLCMETQPQTNAVRNHKKAWDEKSPGSRNADSANGFIKENGAGYAIRYCLNQNDNWGARGINTPQSMMGKAMACLFLRKNNSEAPAARKERMSTPIDQYCPKKPPNHSGLESLQCKKSETATTIIP